MLNFMHSVITHTVCLIGSVVPNEMLKVFPGTILCCTDSKHKEFEEKCAWGAGSSQLCCTNHSTFDPGLNQQADPFIKVPTEMGAAQHYGMSQHVTAEAS